MPKGPRGEKRPADVIGAAVMVMRIATGEIEEPKNPPRGHAGGKKGGPARAAALSPKRRKAIAKTAAAKRWERKQPN